MHGGGGGAGVAVLYGGSVAPKSAEMADANAIPSPR